MNGVGTQSINWNYLGDDNDEEIVRLAFRTLDRLDFGLIKWVRRFECKDDNEGKWMSSSSVAILTSGLSDPGDNRREDF